MIFAPLMFANGAASFGLSLSANLDSGTKAGRLTFVGMRMPWRSVQNQWRQRRKGIAKEVPALAGGLGGSGAAIAGAAAFGPPGALIGGVASVGGRKVLEALGVERVFDTVAERIAERHLGQDERERVATAYTAALKGIAKQADEGLRNDGFFNQPRADDGRTNAEEVLENVLRRAQDAYEQRKAERLGELFAYIARHTDVTPAHAHRLITLVGRLTFRQLLWLGLFKSAEEHKLPDWSSSGALGVRDQGFVLEILELAQLGMFVRKDHRKISTFADVNPALMQTVLDGSLLVEAMDLQRAEPEDCADLAEVLRRVGTVDATEGRHRLDAVVPPGSPPDQRRVKVDLRVVEMSPPRLTPETLGLDADDPRGQE